MEVKIVTLKDRKHSIIKSIEMPCRPMENDLLFVDDIVYKVISVLIKGESISVEVAISRPGVEYYKDAFQDLL
jgi:hypothetical protein